MSPPSEYRLNLVIPFQQIEYGSGDVSLMGMKGIASVWCHSLWESQLPFREGPPAAQWRGTGGEELPQLCE